MLWIQVAAFEIQQAWRLFEQRIRSRKGFFGAASPFFGDAFSDEIYSHNVFFQN